MRGGPSRSRFAARVVLSLAHRPAGACSLPPRQPGSEPMSVGLMALLDDVAGLAKVAAASVDDVIGHAAKAGAKSAGVVIDDAAVTPRYVVGFAAERELPIVARIAQGLAEEQAGVPAADRAPARLLRRVGDHAAPDDRRRLSRLRGRGEGLRVDRAARRRTRTRRSWCPEAGGRPRARGPEGRERDQDRLHPVGRDHGDRARHHPGERLLDPRRRAGGGRHPDHRRGLRRGGADREGRRHRGGAGAERRAHAARPAVARRRDRPRARHAGASCGRSPWSAPRR